MKLKLIILAIVPLLFVGCLNDLFDKGDAEKVFDGPAQIEFKPLQSEFNLSAGQATVQIQLIGAHRDSDLSVSFTAAGAGNNPAVAGTHYNVSTSSPATIAAGTSAVTVVIDLIEDSLDGETVQLQFNLSDDNEVEPAENLRTANVFISG